MILTCAKIGVRDEICKGKGRNKCYNKLKWGLGKDFVELFGDFGELFLPFLNI